MKQIKNAEFGGERPLFASQDLYIENVTIHAGESALKECARVEAVNCRFEGKYPFWHNDGFVVRHCLFTEGARAALWYSRHLQMSDTLVEAPKMFREMDDIHLENVQLPHAAETLWHCRNVVLKNVEVKEADYLFMHSENIHIEDYRQQGNYSFQYCRNVEIRRCCHRLERCLLEHRECYGLRLRDRRRVSGLAFPQPAVGQLQDIGHTTLLLCTRFGAGKLYFCSRCRPGF